MRRLKPERTGPWYWRRKTGRYRLAGQYCCYPKSWFLPDADVWLAQKLAIECSEMRFRLTANRIR